MLKIASLWKQHRASSEEAYYKGNIGNVDILLFHNQSNHENSPAFDLCIAEHRKKKTSYTPGPPRGEDEIPKEKPIPMPEPEFDDRMYDEGDIPDEDQEPPF